MKLITFLTSLNSDTIAVFERLGCKNLQRNIDIYEFYTEVKKNNPNFSTDGCCIEVAAEFGLDKRTIYRVVSFYKSEYM